MMMKPAGRMLGKKVGVLLVAFAVLCSMAVPAWADVMGVAAAPVAQSVPATGNSGGSSSSEAVADGGDATPPAVTAYTVTDSAGNELQRIEQGQKCRIIVAVRDPRIHDPAQLTTTLNRPGSDPVPLAVNVKVVSTGTFASPSLGDITTTTISDSSIYNGALHYSIILNDITYLGGTQNELKLDIAYNNGLPMTTIAQAISQCGPAASEQQNAKQAALVVQSSSYGTSEVQAGHNFTLSAVILVTGGTSGAENVAVNLTLPEDITVVSGSADSFIGNMAAGTTSQVDFLLTARAAAATGSKNITVNVTGNAASDGTALTASKTVTVPVTQPDRFEISNVNIPENMVVGEESYGTVNLVNKGKSTVYNVEAELQGTGFTVDEGAKKFIGNVASGTQSSQDFNLTAEQAGTVNAVLVVTYEDEKGTVKSLSRDVVITVDDTAAMDPGLDPGMGMDPSMGMEIPEQANGALNWVWIVVGLAAVVIIAAIVFGVLKRKKRQKAAAKLMEDDDEDV